MDIIVAAQACRISGALTIYKQFIEHLQNHHNGHRWIIFVDPSMPQPKIEGIEYVQESNHSWKNRIYWNHKGCKEWCVSNKISPSYIISLQNTGIKTEKPQIIYYHQSLPLFKFKWFPWRKNELSYFLYKIFYPLFVKKTINDKTTFVVQTSSIKERFCKRYCISKDKVYVYYPDVAIINPIKNDSFKFEANTFNFVYPAIPVKYKRHLFLAEIINRIKEVDNNIADKIRIHLTIRSGQLPKFEKYLKKSNLQKNFVLHGSIEHSLLLNMIMSSNGLIFPSLIESFGLPLLEAAALGKKILVSDIDVFHDVLKDYEGVEFIKENDLEKWANEIILMTQNNYNYTPIKNKESQWNEFFSLIH